MEDWLHKGNTDILLTGQRICKLSQRVGGICGWLRGSQCPAMMGVWTFCQKTRLERWPSAAPGLFLSLHVLTPTLWGILSSAHVLEASAPFEPVLAPFYASSCRRNCSQVFCRFLLHGQSEDLSLHSL